MSDKWATNIATSAAAVQAILSATTSIWSTLLPASAAIWIFPPVGNLRFLAGVSSFIVTALAAYFATRVPYHYSLYSIAASGLLSIGFLFAYMHLWNRYVVIPDNHPASATVIGDIRTPEAEKCCAGMQNQDLLVSDGSGENQVFRFWTEASVDKVRRKIVGVFDLLMAFLTVTFICFARKMPHSLRAFA